MENVDIFNDLLDDNEGQNLNGYVDESSIDFGLTEDDENYGYLKGLNLDELDDEDKRSTHENDDDDNDDAISSFLKSRGINPNSVKFENENNEIEEYSFYEMTKEEQLQFLDAVTDNDLDTHEIDAVNFLRENGLTLQELIDLAKKEAVESLNSQNQTYSVDQFSDDELFVADLKNKFGDELSDEELLEELETAKTSENLFNKKVARLRAEYKAYEDQENKKREEESNAELMQQRDEYVKTLTNAAVGLSVINETAELDDSDKNEILNFILTEDYSGKSGLQKALEDPETMFKAAWYVKHGDDVFKELHSYYKNEMAKLTKQQEKTIKPKPQSVVKKTNKQHTRTSGPLKLEDLY